MYFLSSSSSVLNELWAINFLFQVPEICYVAYKLVQRRSHVPVCHGGQDWGVKTWCWGRVSMPI